MFRVRLTVSECPGFLAAENVVENARVQHGAVKTQGAME